VVCLVGTGTGTLGWLDCGRQCRSRTRSCGSIWRTTKQMVVVTDHDSRVLARRTFRCKAWDLGSALDWARVRACKSGFAGVTVACEPSGHRWRVLGQLAAVRGMPFVCVQPTLSSWARKTEDLTSDKTDDKDAVLIARLTSQLRCYLPEPVDPTWAATSPGRPSGAAAGDAHPVCPADPRLTGVRGAGSVGGGRAAVQVDHLGCRPYGHRGPRRREPGPLPPARAGPVHPAGPRRGGPPREDQTVPADRPKVFAALTDPTMLTSGVVEHRQAALERVGWDPDRLGPGRHRPGSTWRRAWSRCWA